VEIYIKCCFKKIFKAIQWLGIIFCYLLCFDTVKCCFWLKEKKLNKIWVLLSRLIVKNIRICGKDSFYWRFRTFWSFLQILRRRFLICRFIQPLDVYIPCYICNNLNLKFNKRSSQIWIKTCWHLTANISHLVAQKHKLLKK